jgi:hypothetical protein
MIHWSLLFVAFVTGVIVMYINMQYGIKRLFEKQYNALKTPEEKRQFIKIMKHIIDTKGDN